MATLAVVKEEEAFDEAAYDLLRAHYYDPIVEYNVVDPRTSRSGHQRTLPRKDSPPRIDSRSPGFAALKREIAALECRGNRPRVLELLRALHAWELRPPSLGGAQPPWARGASGGDVAETIDLTADDAEVVDVDAYIIEVLLYKVVAIKSEPGGVEIAVEIAEPVRFAVKPEPDADPDPAAASQLNALPGLDAQPSPVAEGLCAESASVLEDGPSSRQTHQHSTAANEATTNEVDDNLAREDAALVEGQRASAAERDGAAADDDANAQLMTASALDDVIKLNVGGMHFETTRAVLTKVKGSMLQRMFGRSDAMLQADPLDGSIFIDRDGERFGIFLDFLRGDPTDGQRMQSAIRAFPKAAQEALVQELNYFGLETAVFGVRPWTDDATFQPGPSMRIRRSERTLSRRRKEVRRVSRKDCAAVVTGGRVILIGGYMCYGKMSRLLRSTEVLDTQTMTFKNGPRLLTHRYDFAAVQLDADRVLVVGGNLKRHADCVLMVGGKLNWHDYFNCDHDPFDTTEILHLSCDSADDVSCDSADSSSSSEVDLVTDSEGEVDDSEEAVDDSEGEVSDDAVVPTLKFTQGPNLISPRAGCAAVALDARRILVVGGYNSSELCYMSSSEILSLDTMAFTPGPTMAARRCGCAAVALDEHRVLVAGVDSGSGPLNTTEILDVWTMAFAPGPSMGSARQDFVAVAVDAQHVLVIGGQDVPNPYGEAQDLNESVKAATSLFQSCQQELAHAIAARARNETDAPATLRAASEEHTEKARLLAVALAFLDEASLAEMETERCLKAASAIASAARMAREAAWKLESDACAASDKSYVALKESYATKEQTLKKAVLDLDGERLSAARNWTKKKLELDLFVSSCHTASLEAQSASLEAQLVVSRAKLTTLRKSIGREDVEPAAAEAAPAKAAEAAPTEEAAAEPAAAEAAEAVPAKAVEAAAAEAEVAKAAKAAEAAKAAKAVEAAPTEEAAAEPAPAKAVEAAAAEAAPKKKRGRKPNASKAKAAHAEGPSEAAPKKKRGRKPNASKAKAAHAEDPSEAAPKKKRGRRSNASKAAAAHAEDSSEAAPKKKKPVGRPSKAFKAAEAEAEAAAQAARAAKAAEAEDCSKAAEAEDSSKAADSSTRKKRERTNDGDSWNGSFDHETEYETE